MSVRRRYFNFPESWTDQAWFARKTQYWEGAFILCYKNTSFFFSHFFQLSFSICKVFRKQTWADGQIGSLRDSRISHWKKDKTSCILLKQPPCC